ncbi:hypothetical protein [Maribacter luteus]|uniref:Uncharacterized protein n=1 Tax=Maribacter luteus TaxID=2594478 RepID=A0A6I2MMY3_9FLAO|nr:hypothetical protein [Maribacter luteus]MRX63544.1 hypothetical protein [Maribacter luteus]
MEKIKEILYDENLHFEHENWKSELDFWDDELKTFTNRLSELVTRWTNDEILEQLEHFQNEFVLHGAVIDDFMETIDKHETKLANRSKMNSESLNVTLVKTHMQLREKMEKQRQKYADLKKEFFRFLSEYM